MKKKVIKNSFLANLEEEIDFSKFLKDLQKNKFIFGCSSAIMFIILSFSFFSSRKWVGAIDVVINTKYCINFGLMNFSDTRVRADFYRDTLDKETSQNLIQNEQEYLRSDEVLKDLYQNGKLNSKKYGFSNIKSFQEFKDNFTFLPKNEHLKIKYKSKNLSETKNVLEKYVQIFKSLSSQKRQSNYEIINNSYKEIVSQTSTRWANSLYQLTEFLNDKKIYGQSYDIPLLDKDVILREYDSRLKVESIINDYENDYETNLRNASLNDVTLNFIHHKKRLEKLNHYIRTLKNFSDYDLSNNYISIILPELKDSITYQDIELINKKLSTKSNSSFEAKKIKFLNKKNNLSKSFRETALINLNLRKDLVIETLLAFGNYEKHLPEFVEKFITFKQLGRELKNVNVFANKIKIYNRDHKYNHHNFYNLEFSRNLNAKKYMLVYILFSILVGILTTIIKENFQEKHK